MAKFSIERADVDIYKNKILELWQENLPGTPPERLDWMQHNPAGAAIWFLAFDQETRELAGTISIMPKVINYQGKDLMVGIVGDFMTIGKYRVFGPAMELQRAAINAMKEFGLTCLYTIPNSASIKLIERSGYLQAMRLVHYVKPIDLKIYISKHLNSFLASLLNPVLRLFISFFSRETYTILKGSYQELSRADSTFDELWGAISSQNVNEVISNRDINYLRWRYESNPLYTFKYLVVKSKENSLSGYIVFTINNNKLEIFDIVSINKEYENRLLKKIIRIAKKNSCQSVYMRMSEDAKYINSLKKFLFLDSKNDAALMAYGESQSFYSKWSFLEGDRNI